MSRTIRIIEAAYPGQPGLDTAVARAMLIRGSEGELPETFRLHVPARIMAFGKQDVIAPGYGAAVRATRDLGFTPVERLAGGRAAVFHEATLAFSWMIPDDDPRSRIRERYRTLSELMVRAFARLGVHSAIGEVPGEYCPGDYSVHSDGRKVMGVGQRLAKRATHIGGVIVVADSSLTRRALMPVYAALGLSWRPETAGALADVVPGVTLAHCAEAVLAELQQIATLERAQPEAATLAIARRLTEEHLSPVGV